VQDLTLATQPDDGCVAGGTVGLLAYFDRRHDRNLGETWSLESIMSPLCLPCKR
jgi:hypothetical protein